MRLRGGQRYVARSLLKHAYRISGDGELPTVESKMHDSFGVTTFYTTSSIRCQAVEHAFPYLLVRLDVDVRKVTQTTVAIPLPIYCGDFFLDAFGDELEQFLCILMLP